MITSALFLKLIAILRHIDTLKNGVIFLDNFNFKRNWIYYNTFSASNEICVFICTLILNKLSQNHSSFVNIY